MRHVPHVLVPSPWHGHLLNLDEQSAHHLRKVLRLRDGAAISYTDGQGRSGEGVLEDDSVAITREAHRSRCSAAIDREDEIPR
jgi:16S rRNA U1498 N3-methylase RsmE